MSRLLPRRLRQLASRVRRFTPGRGRSAPLDLVVRRLAVVDESGTERIILETVDDLTRILVRTAPPGDGHSTGVEVYAIDAIDADPPIVGVNLAHAGTITDEWSSRPDDR